jgi:hypothetical protein
METAPEFGFGFPADAGDSFTKLEMNMRGVLVDLLVLALARPAKD